MSYNGSGTFNINTTGQPVVAGTVISSSAFNSLTSDLATGLSTAITKDGQTTTTARITFAQGLTSSLSTDSSSVSTGSIITDGGVGIAKNVYVGGTLNVTGSTTLTNPVINNIKMGYTTTATAAGTTTLTVSSNYRQFFTGTTTQTIVLPVTSTLVTGMAYEIENNSTGLLTVNSSGGNLVGTIPAGVCAHAVCIGTTLTTAADWDWDYISTTTITGTGANVLGTSPTITTPTISSLSSAAATALTLQSAGTTAITVDTSQNVGIGTTSPAGRLDSYGDSTNPAGIFRRGGAYGNIESTDTNRTAKWTFGRDNASTGNFVIAYNDSTKTSIDTSGNVGIGTTSPNIGGYGANSRILTVQGVSGSYAIAELSSNSANSDGTFVGRLDFSSDGQAANYKNVASIASTLSGSTSTKFGSTLRFYTRADNAGSGSPIERMRILSGGSVCVNATQAEVDGTSRLIVSTTTASGIAAEFSNNTSGTCAVAINNSGAATATLVNWYANNNYRAAITWNGTLVVYGTSSDARLKENITDAGSGLAKLADVKIRSFDWKESGAHTDFGVVAQELQSVAPEAVLVGKDNEDGSIKESWSVDSSILVPAMIKAIQELKAINDSLTARIVALEAK